MSLSSCTTLTTDHPNLLQGFDFLVREALIKILGAPLEDKQWLQARLAVGRGGLGIRGSEDHAGAAFASSFLSSQPLVKELLGRDDDSTPPLPRNLLDSLTAKPRRGGQSYSATRNWRRGGFHHLAARPLPAGDSFIKAIYIDLKIDGIVLK